MEGIREPDNQIFREAVYKTNKFAMSRRQAFRLRFFLLGCQQRAGDQTKYTAPRHR
jgi:hypothetical protein